MKTQLHKKVMLGLAMLTQITISIAQDSETTLNLKYWTMRERFRKYFISIGSGQGQSIPVAQITADNNRCPLTFPSSNGWRRWGDATSYLGDYMCTLATEYALLEQEGKSTKATLNELYYAINALERLDGKAEFAFNNSQPLNNYNGFFLRDDVDGTTMSKWATEYTYTGGYDSKLNYKCHDASYTGNIADIITGNSSTNEPSFDQYISLFQGFMFVKRYVPNLFVKPTASDGGFNIIDKIKVITERFMDNMSGSDKQLLIADHSTEFLYNTLNPSVFFFSSAGLGAGVTAISACADNDVRGNWIMTNPVTNRKVGATSNDTKNQDIRPFVYPLAKIGEIITGNTYQNRDIHHEVVDQPSDGLFCLDIHDYHIPISWTKTHVWDVLEQLPAVSDEFNIAFPHITFSKKPLVFKITLDPTFTGKIEALARNMYLIEGLATISGTWSHQNVNKFASQYGHENFDLEYACLNNTSPLKSQQHYIDLLSKMGCEGPHNYGVTDFTSYWNAGTAYEIPNPNDVPETDSYNWGEFNANDWMWMYNMYRLHFGDASFPKYEETSCNCKKSPAIEQNTDPITNNLTNNVVLKRSFKNYLNLGISIKEYTSQTLNILNNKDLTVKTELVVCNGAINILNNGTLQTSNAGGGLPSDSVRIVVRNGASINVGANGLLNIGYGTKVIIQKGALLNLIGNNARVIVESTAQLIIEPGGLLQINNNGKLIVNDNGLVVTKTTFDNTNQNDNAVLTFNQGANIQLKGDNAVLELNGRLHIGDNAVFGFTYPGANSGYIKFNRGAGTWWNNLAPNNAHITCGTNSKFVITGQSKTDKIIEIDQIDVAMPKTLTSCIINKGLILFNVGDARLESSAITALTNCTFKGSTTLPAGSLATRGLLVFGQPVCFINNCDFLNLGTGLVGATFYLGNPLSGVTNNLFKECSIGIFSVGTGVNLTNNTFLDNGIAINANGLEFNSLVKNNTITAPAIPNNPTTAGDGAVGVLTIGNNGTFELKENTINQLNLGVFAENNDVKFSCNDLQDNSFALYGSTNSKINMSTLLGGGNNNASNCKQFATFSDANFFESHMGYNSFKISNTAPCAMVTSPSPPHLTTLVCPIIADGSLNNFTSFNTSTNKYELLTELNFWRAPYFPGNTIEQNYFRLYKSGTSSNQYVDVFPNVALTNVGQTACPNNGNGNGSGNGNGGNGNINSTLTHPLDFSSITSFITTPSFNNQKLQQALQFSMAKMSDMGNENKLNQAADLLTEILKYNYAQPVLNQNDKYLLELTYQRLFSCVAQLTEINRANLNTKAVPPSLIPRLNDLLTIIDLRTFRKDFTDIDYKTNIDLIKLDKALVYGLFQQRTMAITEINNILATNPKTSHVELLSYWKCLYSAEEAALNNSITVDDALGQLGKCAQNLIKLKATNNARLTNPADAGEVTYAEDNAIAVYPNPTQGSLAIAYDLKEYSTITFEIFDVQGKKMLSYNLNSTENKFNIENLNLKNGVYLYTITADGNNLLTKKLVVVK